MARVRSLAQLDLDLSAARWLRMQAWRSCARWPRGGNVEEYWRLDEQVRRLQEVIRAKEAKAERRARQQRGCEKRDSRGVPCEVRGPHTVHVCPGARDAHLRARGFSCTG